ncbi:3-deoxy-D-manno-octulosonic acid transferase [bacterium]|nr:3-deoxy-D-manno-octulosonic acid transferase [bacterium]
MLFIVIYQTLLIILAVILSPLILLAFIIQPKFRAGFWHKIGFYDFDKTQSASKKTIIFHAVSVGEVNAVEALVKKAREEFKDYNIILTTVTKTGREVAVKKLTNYVDEIAYFPYDFCFSVRSFLNTYKPEKIVMAETEIWPCFVYLVNKAKTQIYVVNGRISPHSYKGYKKASFFFKNILKRYTKILMQTKDDAQRIIDIGAPKEITKCMGNLKFDISKNLSPDKVESLKNELKTHNYKVLIAASTHKGEDEIVLKSYVDLKKNHPELKLLLAPRHPQRYDTVEELIKNTKLPYGKRSMNSNFEGNDIIMLDTMGELGKMFSICYTAFIGGSFSTTGGHNPLEANIWDKPVVSGPTVFNFKDIYNSLTKTNAAFIVNNQPELTVKLSELLTDKEFYSKACEDAAKIFRENSGAIDFAINEIKD